MDTHRWNRIQEIFAAALELDGAARDAWIAEACENDPELWREVLSLLDADDSGHSLLDAGAAKAADGLGILEETSRVGQRVGSWQLVERIGQGGMGAVYLAERADGEFEQRVALKVIKRGMDSEEILSRFRSERQILARLDHPNIARFLDGGLTPDGVPWFTMEYVDGVPIDRFCDENGLSINERLDLFGTVCDTVSYAQRNLVVHRDLKPTNILVSGGGVAKLLDFGIAKLLDTEEGDALLPGSPAITRTGHRMMTPGYAAPEQIRGEPVTTATDVYALGVILYELLTGQRPYAPTDESAAALEQAICDTNPAKPSSVVTRPGPAPRASETGEATTKPEETGATRQARPAQLRRKLAGDLDNICLMALRKEPARRYGSAEQLHEDVDRYRAGRPVHARPDTALYRLQKFARRNRAGVLAGAAVLAAVVALVAFYTAQVTSERDRAQREAQKARTVSDFLAGLFEVADPSESLGETITARELLDRGARRIEDELSDQPEVQATMMDVVGSVYHSLGLYDDADTLLGRALETRSRLFPEDHADLAASLLSLGVLRHTRGAYDESVSLLERGLEMRIRLHGREHRDVAESLHHLAGVLNDQGKLDAAEPRFREAIRIWESTGHTDSPELFGTMNSLALLIHERGDLQEAEELFRVAIAREREALGDSHPELGTTLYNYSQVLRELDRFEESEATIREALAIDRKLYGEAHPNVAYDLISLARLFRKRYDHVNAEKYFREALAMRRQFHGEEHPEVAYAIADLASTLFNQARYAEARTLVREALEMHRRVHGPDHPVLGERLRDLGRIEHALGNYAGAEPYLRQALELRAKAWGTDHHRYAETMLYLSRAVAAQGRVDEAVSIQRTALRLSAEVRGVDSRDYRHQAHGLAQTLVLAGEAEEAETLFRDVIAKRSEAYGADSPLVAAVQHDLAKLLREQERLGEAEELLRSAIASRRAKLPAGHPSLGRSLGELGRVLLDAGRAEDAEPLLRDGLEMLRAALPAGHPDVGALTRTLERCRAASAGAE